MKKILTLLLIVSVSIMVVSCDNSSTTETQTYITDTLVDSELENVDFEDGYYEDYLEEAYTVLDGFSESYEITEEGIYVLTGTILQTITINVGEDDDVRLILDDVTIQTSENACIMVLSADDITISAPENTINQLTDSSNYSADNTEYNAVIYSESDLLINGLGQINIDANYNNAIVSKDDLMLVDITLVIETVDDGIIGRDSLLVQNANISIDAVGDALKSTNEEKSEEGYIYIESGSFTLTSNSDGLDAVNFIVITGGEFDIEAYDQGINSNTNIYITGGTLSIDSNDDAINANSLVEISGGTITINTNDDGIKGNEAVVISGGTILIQSSYEGIESTSITISGGTITVYSTDDGINAADGSTDGSPISLNTDNILTITGGLIKVFSNSDAIDVNGSIYMNGGELFVYGTISDRNSALDYDNEFIMSNGTLVAVGATGMTLPPSDSSTQASVMVLLNDYVSVGDTLLLKDSNGDVIFSFEIEKSNNNIVISTENIVQGETYTIEVDSLFEVNFKSNDIVTYIDEYGYTTYEPMIPGVVPGPGDGPRR
ncbi:carbohydrate-binding domain-containing protein [Candidatus Izemoplasma sp. B36]|uniref:carbohydrate-binding domain-containing protein n=1 Tax=Candidatus Izemoplasma sp. B36 TaxID=3242468 RepID=UPI003556BAE8